MRGTCRGGPRGGITGLRLVLAHTAVCSPRAVGPWRLSRAHMAPEVQCSLLSVPEHSDHRAQFSALWHPHPPIAPLKPSGVTGPKCSAQLSSAQDASQAAPAWGHTGTMTPPWEDVCPRGAATACTCPAVPSLLARAAAAETGSGKMASRSSPTSRGFWGSEHHRTGAPTQRNATQPSKGRKCRHRLQRGWTLRTRSRTDRCSVIPLL